MKKENEAGEDLGIKIGNKEEAAWTQIRDDGQKNLERLKREVMIHEEIIRFADRKVKAYAALNEKEDNKAYISGVG